MQKNEYNKNMKTILIWTSIILFISLALPAWADRTPIDDAIEAAIETQFVLDDNLTQNDDVEIDSHNGVVTITGEVSSEDARNYVMDIVQSTYGVASIDSSGLHINHTFQ
jgi:hypothetical protein